MVEQREMAKAEFVGDVPEQAAQLGFGAAGPGLRLEPVDQTRAPPRTPRLS